MYGRPPPIITRYLPGTTVVHEVDKELCDRDELLRRLKQNLENSRNTMKQQADAHRRNESFEVDHLVFLKLQPFRQQSVFKRANQKLANKYFGPYRVMEKIGPVTYKLELPEHSKVHPVFHVSCLKRRIGNGVVSHRTPVSDDDLLVLEPLEVKDFCWV